MTPSPRQQQLIQAALSRPDVAVPAWTSWRASGGPEASDRPSRRLLPLAYWNLRNAGLPHADLAFLRDAYDQTLAENRRKLGDARRVLEALVEADIDVLVLKGAALARFYEADIGLRGMRDVDVLVRSTHLTRAVAVLSRLGYRPGGIGPACLERYAYQVSPGWPFVAPDASDVDLHWHTLHESRAPEADDDFWQGAVALDFQGLSVKALNATDQLLHVCIHGLQREPQQNLRWIVDAMRILRYEAEPIDWSRLLGQVIRRRLVPHARQCFGYLAETLAAPIPRAVLDAVQHAPVSWRERAEFRARARPSECGPLGLAVLAHQQEVRCGQDGSLRALVRALPRHLWGTAGWWQMPAWSLADRLRIELRQGSRLATRVFRPPERTEAAIDAPLYELGQRITFGRDGNGLGALGPGWSYAEASGVWSEGVLARIALDVRNIPNASPLLLEVEIAAVLVRKPEAAALDVHVLVASSRVARWQFTAPLDSPTVLRATIAPAVVAAFSPCTIDFRILRPCTPASLGASGDHRLLGIHLKSLRLGNTRLGNAVA